MFLKIRHSLKKSDVTICAISSNVSPKFFRIVKNDVTSWIKQLLKITHTIFVVFPIHMDCLKPKTFDLGSILKKISTLYDVHPSATKLFPKNPSLNENFVCQCGTGVDSMNRLGTF